MGPGFERVSEEDQEISLVADNSGPDLPVSACRSALKRFIGLCAGFIITKKTVPELQTVFLARGSSSVESDLQAHKFNSSSRNRFR